MFEKKQDDQRNSWSQSGIRAVAELQGSTVCWRRGDDMGNISRPEMVLVGCSVVDPYYDRDRGNQVVLNFVRRSVDLDCSCRLC